MKSVFVVFSMLAMVIAIYGCSDNPQAQGSQANSAESAPYAAGTGVSSSSFDRHPRFYSGQNGDQTQSPATQPASAQ